MDVNITLSIINMKLRDFYSSLEELLQDFEDSDELVNILISNGYKYNENLNKFVIEESNL